MEIIIKGLKNRHIPLVSWVRLSNPQYQQLDNAQGDHEHGEGYGIVVKPIIILHTHGGYPHGVVGHSMMTRN
jgi:hypothetical protein